MKALLVALLLTACGGAVAPSSAGVEACGPLFAACMVSPTADESTCSPEGSKLSCECHNEVSPGHWESNFCTYEAA